MAQFRGNDESSVLKARMTVITVLAALIACISAAKPCDSDFYLDSKSAKCKPCSEICSQVASPGTKDTCNEKCPAFAVVGRIPDLNLEVDDIAPQISKSTQGEKDSHAAVSKGIKGYEIALICVVIVGLIGAAVYIVVTHRNQTREARTRRRLDQVLEATDAEIRLMEEADNQQQNNVI